MGMGTDGDQEPASERAGQGYVDSGHLDTVSRWVQPAKQRGYERLHLATGFRVLDVGCGPGTDTINQT